MGLANILIFAALILVYRLLFRSRGRGWVLLVSSVLAIFWLQPATPIRGLDFWLPLATLALSAAGWALTQPAEARAGRDNWVSGAVVAGIVLLVGLTRWLPWDALLTPSTPPATLSVLIGILACGLLVFTLARWSKPVAPVLWAATALLIAVLLVLKVPALAALASAGLRGLARQSVERASALDIRWLGFSYVAFRLIATLRDRQNRRLPAMSLREYLTYIIFFPAFTAGPIDRPERFLKDLRAELPFDTSEALAGGRRLATGIFAKFALADGLAYFSLGPGNALSIRSAGWMWLALLAYSLRIYLDFAGYTDIAIGLGRWLGVKLPENFLRPYLKPNLTQFWNNWHMTLTQWFRAYYFNPLTRALRTRKKPIAPVWIILFTQVTTFVLIGLWHGGTLNFILWGLWHGLGLFVQNRFTDWARPRFATLEDKPALQKALTVASTSFTFLYVSLGWVWFVLPEPGQAVHVFGRLVGI
jgi:alginate O-acetyltransferase complex protein AlgI